MAFKATLYILLAIFVVCTLQSEQEQRKIHQYLKVKVEQQRLGFRTFAASGTILLVGDSACGKSTTANCLYHPYNVTMPTSPFVTCKQSLGNNSFDCTTGVSLQYSDDLQMYILDTPGFDYGLENITNEINDLKAASPFSFEIVIFMFKPTLTRYQKDQLHLTKNFVEEQATAAGENPIKVVVYFGDDEPHDMFDNSWTKYHFENEINYSEEGVEELYEFKRFVRKLHTNKHIKEYYKNDKVKLRDSVTLLSTLASAVTLQNSATNSVIDKGIIKDNVLKGTPLSSLATVRVASTQQTTSNTQSELSYMNSVLSIISTFTSDIGLYGHAAYINKVINPLLQIAYK